MMKILMLLMTLVFVSPVLAVEIGPSGKLPVAYGMSSQSEIKGVIGVSYYEALGGIIK